MWGISLIIQPVLLCHIYPAHSLMSPLFQSRRGILNENEEEHKVKHVNPITTLKVRTLLTTQRQRRRGICLMKCSRSGRGRGECLWIVLLVVTDSTGLGYIPVFLICIHLVNTGIWGDWDVDRETGPGSTDVNTRL